MSAIDSHISVLFFLSLSNISSHFVPSFEPLLLKISSIFTLPFSIPLYSLRKCYIGSPIPHIIHTLCLSSYQFPNIISVSFKLLYLALDTDQFGFFTRLSNKFISNKSNKLQFHTFALMLDYLSLSTLSTVLYFSRFY